MRADTGLVRWGCPKCLISLSGLAKHPLISGTVCVCVCDNEGGWGAGKRSLLHSVMLNNDDTSLGLDVSIICVFSESTS